ncbi:MAG: MauE/DoxX family redox-associated membrane protein [Pyrinomonadaceae bacterium]
MTSIRVEYAIQIALGLIFASSAFSKIKAPRAFVDGVAVHGSVPPTASYVVSALIIPLETFLAFAHLTGWQLGTAATIGTITLIAFAGSTVFQLWRGRQVPCLCFGTATEMVSRQTVARQALVLGGECLLLTTLGLRSLLFSESASLVVGVYHWMTACAGAMVLIAILRWVLRLREVSELGQLWRSRVAIADDDADDSRMRVQA